MITCTDAKTGLPITFGVAYIIMVESQADDTRAKVSLAWGAGIITHLVLESHDDVVAKIDALHTVVALDAEQEVGQRDGADRPLALVPDEPCKICGTTTRDHNGQAHRDAGEDV